MKKTLFLIVSCLLAVITINAQNLSLDEIIKKQAEAIGQEKLSKVNTIKMVGKMSVMGMEIPITMLRKRPNKMKMEVEVMGSKMVQTYNGTEGYMINPMAGSTEPQKVEGEQLEEFKRNANMDGTFYNYKENGSTLELLGTEDVNGKKAYKIKMTLKPSKEDEAGKTSTLFIDCENFLLVKIVAMQKDNMSGMETEGETYFTYKQIDGISIFSSMEINAGGNNMKMNFDEIKFNEELADSLFDKPTN